MTSSRGSPSAVDRRRALRSPSRSRSPTIVRPTSIAFLPPTDSRSPPTETCNRATRRRRQQRRRHRDAHGRRRFAPSRRSLTSLGWGVNSRWLEGGKHDGGRSRTPFGIVFRRGVREARATREEKLRGRLEGRRCRRAATAAYRFYSPPLPPPPILFALTRTRIAAGRRGGAPSLEARTPPRRLAGFTGTVYPPSGATLSPLFLIPLRSDADASPFLDERRGRREGRRVSDDRFRR